LRVSVLHSLLLRIHLRAGGHCERYQYRKRDNSTAFLSLLRAAWSWLKQTT
jgi:hypothetical protein